MIFIPIGILCVCFLLAFIMNQCRKRAEKRLFAKRARCTASVIATIQDIQSIILGIMIELSMYIIWFINSM